MARFKEIEVKWDASKIERGSFNRALRSYAKGKKYHKVVVAGFDYYYTSKDGYVVRHRHGINSNELTVKARVSKKSTTVRREINQKLPKESSPLSIKEFMSEIGFDKVMPIFKDCDIYFIKDGKYVVDVVWYRVTCGDAKPRLFLEVEVHEAPEAVSLTILQKWKKFMQINFNLTDADIIHESLYEIYSGKRYKISKANK
jgi:adenylate cyclase class IV